MNHARDSLPFAATLAPESGVSLVTPRRDLLDALFVSRRHRTLLRLAAAAELTEDLASGGPFTLFAPTDEAFAALGGQLDAWLDADRTEDLCDRLEYHLVRGALELGQALAAGALRSVHGAELHVRHDAGVVRVDRARLVAEPLVCSNGVLMVIDAVLAPRALALTELKPSAAANRTGMDELRGLHRTTPRDQARAALLRLSPLRPRYLDDVRGEAPGAMPVGAAALRALRSG